MTGFESPNHTQVPNELFEIMPVMGECELKVTLAIVRQTLGYHKKKDPISLSRLQKLTGLSRPGCIEGTDKAVKRGFVEIVGTGSRGVNIFGLVINFDQSDEPDQLKIFTRTGKKSLHTKETTQKKKENTLTPGGVDPSQSKPKKERERNPMYDAIKDIWGYTAVMNGAMEKMLKGVATKAGWSEYNLETPIEADDLRRWAKWYRQTMLNGNDHFNMLEERIKINSSITQWQETHQPKTVQADPALDLSVAVAFDPKDNLK